MIYHYTILTAHISLCVILVSLVLLQQGKGADMGASLGGGSNSVFGAGGATSLVVKATTIVAILFMATSVLLVRSYRTATFGVTASDTLAGSKIAAEARAAADNVKLVKPVEGAESEAAPAKEASLPKPVEAAPVPVNPAPAP